MKNKDIEKGVIRLLQGDIPPVLRPFKWIADVLGVSEDEVLGVVKKLKDEGKLKRVSVLLRHRSYGFLYNAMVCVKVEPEELLEAVAKLVAKDAHVTHCYHRKPSKGWDFNLFFMYHGKSKEEVLEGVRNLIAGVEGVKDFKVLFSTREFKKTSVRYVE